MPKLILLRGYSGSGKTTQAIKWLNEDKDNRVRVNRDDLRQSLFNEEGVLANDKESLITKIQREIAVSALKAGKDVINDDTNLRRKFAVEWADLAVKVGAEFEVIDWYVPLEACLVRNRKRANEGGRLVPEDAIRNQVQRFPYPWPSIEPRNPEYKVESYIRPEYNNGLTYLVDIDGTVATFESGHRGPFDWAQVGGDDPRVDICHTIEVLSEGAYIVFLSGRDGSCRTETEDWLTRQFPDMEYELFMREAGDNRPDYVVKYELFNKHARHRTIVGVFDDRPQVIRLWRELGLTVFDVGNGIEF